MVTMIGTKSVCMMQLVIPVIRAILIPVAEPVIPETDATKKQYKENEPISGSDIYGLHHKR